MSKVMQADDTCSSKYLDCLMAVVLESNLHESPDCCGDLDIAWVNARKTINDIELNRRVMYL